MGPTSFLSLTILPLSCFQPQTKQWNWNKRIFTLSFASFFSPLLHSNSNFSAMCGDFNLSAKLKLVCVVVYWNSNSIPMCTITNPRDLTRVFRKRRLFLIPERSWLVILSSNFPLKIHTILLRFLVQPTFLRFRGLIR